MGLRAAAAVGAAAGTPSIALYSGSWAGAAGGGASRAVDAATGAVHNPTFAKQHWSDGKRAPAGALGEITADYAGVATGTLRSTTASLTGPASIINPGLRLRVVEQPFHQQQHQKRRTTTESAKEEEENEEEEGAQVVVCEAPVEDDSVPAGSPAFRPESILRVIQAKSEERSDGGAGSQQRFIRDCFKYFDCGSTGSVDAAGFAGGLERCGILMPPVDVAAAFQRFCDGDGEEGSRGVHIATFTKLVMAAETVATSSRAADSP